MSNFRYILFKDFTEGEYKGERLFVSTPSPVGVQFWRVDGALPLEADRAIAFLEEYKDLKVARINPPEKYFDGYWIEALKRQGIVKY